MLSVGETSVKALPLLIKNIYPINNFCSPQERLVEFGQEPSMKKYESRIEKEVSL